MGGLSDSKRGVLRDGGSRGLPRGRGDGLPDRFREDLRVVPQDDGDELAAGAYPYTISIVWVTLMIQGLAGVAGHCGEHTIQSPYVPGSRVSLKITVWGPT